MKTVTKAELVRASATELRVLAGIFNSAMVCAEPLSAEWYVAVEALNAITAERNRRLDQPFRLTA